MPLKIYTGNRMENLVEALADVVGEPLASPFTPEVIVVQSKGMQRWLAMELAGRFGVWANCDYPFPNSMVWRLFRAAMPDLPEDSPFSPENMTWTIMGLLPGLLGREEFVPLARYLAEDKKDLKRFQLSEKIADSFDQYTLFRPEMLLQWEEGGEGGWQAALWRELAPRGSGRHRGRLKEEFLSRVEAGMPAGAVIPERISVFGISYLPKYHLDILAATARITDVHIFLLSPTREYWADIVSGREKARLAPAERAYRIEGNTLLASLGKLGRDFSDMVIEIGDTAAVQEDLYADPGGASLLEAVQSDILNLRDIGPGEEKRVIDPEDRSVQIHSCHSPMREVEVLYDNLLFLLENEEGLEPRDIVVMTPDIETYAPFISSVFESCRGSAVKIPYSIGDRSLTSEGEIVSVFLRILGLPGTRLTVPQVFDILETSPVMRCFDLDHNEIETVRGWIGETRVRWGMDEHDRARLGLPEYRENSWRAGLDRLLLGYAMPDEGDRLFNGKLPYDGMEGSSARTLGKFADFIDRIAHVVEKLSGPKTLGEWRDQFRMLLEGFIAADDGSARELATVAQVLEGLGEMEAGCGFTENVELDVIRSWLSARLSRQEKGLGFMTGGVTFCAMLPMRSIPFRVVALMGMNDGAFPRQGRPPGFDLIARNPRRGDRSLRDEDRYLFLEAMLSARDCLYISYTGQSINDNSEIPPSVLVSEFIDAIDRGFTPGKGVKAGMRLVTKHRLQAFSRDYFMGGSELFSYSEENCAALVEKRQNPRRLANFITAPIPLPADQWKDVTLPVLLRFFDNPARFFLEKRLGIRLEDVAAPLQDREPFSLEGLEAYGLRQELLEISLQGDDPREFLPVARCLGLLPPALHGEAAFSTVAGEAGDFADAVIKVCGGKSALDPVDFEIEVGEFRLSGRLDRVLPERMLRYRCAKMKAKDLVRAWIEHLVLNQIRREGYPRETLLMMTDESASFRPVDDPAPILRTILDLYREGLTTPLRFFPESSMAYAHEREWKPERARQKWEEGYNNYPGEGDDPHFRLCFGRIDPFNDDFDRTARALLEPLLEYRK